MRSGGILGIAAFIVIALNIITPVFGVIQTAADIRVNMPTWIEVITLNDKITEAYPNQILSFELRIIIKESDADDALKDIESFTVEVLDDSGNSLKWLNIYGEPYDIPKGYPRSKKSERREDGILKTANGEIGFPYYWEIKEEYTGRQYIEFHLFPQYQYYYQPLHPKDEIVITTPFVKIPSEAPTGVNYKVIVFKNFKNSKKLGEESLKVLTKKDVAKSISDKASLILGTIGIILGGFFVYKIRNRIRNILKIAIPPIVGIIIIILGEFIIRMVI